MKTTVKGIMVGLAIVGLLIGMAPQMAWSLPVDDHGKGDNPKKEPEHGVVPERPTNPKFGDNSAYGIWNGKEWVRTPNMGHWDGHKFVNGTAVHLARTFVDSSGNCWGYTGRRWVNLPSPRVGHYSNGAQGGVIDLHNGQTYTDSTGHVWKLVRNGSGHKWVPDMLRMLDGYHWKLSNGLGERVNNDQARRFGYYDCCICSTSNHRTLHNAVAGKTARPKLSLENMGVITTAGKMHGKIWVKAQQQQLGQSNGKPNDQTQIQKATYTSTVSKTGFASPLGSSHGGPPNSLRMHSFRTRLGR